MWEQTGIHYTLGTIAFWYFIVPKVLDLMEVAGCEYLFLFEADLSEYSDLVNYYVSNLEFVDASEHSAVNRCMVLLADSYAKRLQHFENVEICFLHISILMMKSKTIG